MGTVGSGWATCIGRIYMAAVLLVYCVYYDLRYKTGLREASRRPHLPRVWKLVSLGFPAATQLGLEVGIFAVATAMIGKLGADCAGEPPDCPEYRELHVHGAAWELAPRPRCAWGKRSGDAIPHAASRAGWTALVLGASFMTCTAIAFWLVPRYIVRIYSPDPAVIRSASRCYSWRDFFSFLTACRRWLPAPCGERAKPARP